MFRFCWDFWFKQKSQDSIQRETMVGFCCKRVNLYLFFFFNQLFFILGALMVGIGSWILVDQKAFIPILQNSSPTFKTGVYVFIGAGAITMVLGFLGCLGAFFGIRFTLGLYFACLLLILSAQITAGLMIYFQQSSLRARIPEVVIDLLQTYDSSDDTNQVLEAAWDFVQTMFACCGWNGPEDWQLNKILWAGKMRFYPCSCSNHTENASIGTGFCALEPYLDTTNVTDWPVKKQGCRMMVLTWLQGNFNVFLGVCTGLAITELLGIGLSIHLFKTKICLH
ncbi:CD82 antigen-like [Thamnophis elegans]|uniref:CD82 antigen-like n=1 Tax=Thamnophis elegans TaxID=35005 RepID=UPI001376AB87|nr:CD82 antigen-like [Thamnophis elegans]